MTLAGASGKRSAGSGAIARSSQAAVVIPARLGSTRFPRKVLARETGKYLLQHVWEGVAGTPGVSRVIIATDSAEVVGAARSFGAEAWLTSPEHRSGTDRVAEVARMLEEDIIVNVQGDEPLIRRDHVERTITLFSGAEAEVVMTTLAVERRDREGFESPHNVKVVRDGRGGALYFSRAPIPFQPAPEGGAPPAGRERPGSLWLHHIGIYGYRRGFLLKFREMEPGELEGIERLEQLRALENGYRILVGITPHPCSGIDTEEEYREFVREHRTGSGGGVR